MPKLEETNSKSSDKITKLKTDIKFIEAQWGKSVYEIKDNILAQYRVICPEVDFSEVDLDKHVKDGCIEISPLEEGKDEEEPSAPAV